LVGNFVYYEFPVQEAITHRPRLVFVVGKEETLLLKAINILPINLVRSQYEQQIAEAQTYQEYIVTVSSEVNKHKDPYSIRLLAYPEAIFDVNGPV
jgi:tRNA G18 (ribose-2'-O)-methylase SpoU